MTTATRAATYEITHVGFNHYITYILRYTEHYLPMHIIRHARVICAIMILTNYCHYYIIMTQSIFLFVF